ncbi:5233_t:CDS:2, partial [Cetraspora pellucida]
MTDYMIKIAKTKTLHSLLIYFRQDRQIPLRHWIFKRVEHELYTKIEL